MDDMIASDNTPPSINTSILAGIVNRIVRTQTISRTDQAMIMSLLSKSTISDAEMKLVNQIFKGLLDGQIRVVD